MLYDLQIVRVMRKFFLLVTAVFVLTGTLSAQNTDVSYNRFKEEYELQRSDYERKRIDEYNRFKAEYYAVFEQFKELYHRYLEEEDAVIDIMASDDGIKISSVKLAPQPKVVTSASDQKKILAENIAKIQTMRPEELLSVLSEKQDSVARIKEAAEVMTEIVSGMKKVAVGEDDPPVNVVIDVVLEPYDPEYFTNLPSLEDAGRAHDVSEPVESSAEDTRTSQSASSESPAAMSSAIPHGRPTDYVRISSPFGTRVHPITRKKHTHKGIDLAAPKMTPIYATADGEVTFSGRNGGYGNFVKINHRNGYKTAYAHMHKIAVKKGADVHKGDLIGYVGTTGSSTGNHLHYEVYYQDKLVDPATTL